MNVNTKFYLQAAESLGLKIRIISETKNLIELRHNNKLLRIKSAATGFNNRLSTIIAEDKFLTLQLLKENDVPIARSDKYSISDIEVIRQDAIEKLPSVIKPNARYQGEFVFANLKNENEVDEALSIMEKGLEKEEEVLVEEFIVGREYRVLVLNDEIIDIVERLPAHIIGDGVNTVETLIDQKNELRQKYNVSENKSISKDSKTLFALKNYNYDLSSTPKKDEHIKLRNNCNFAEGGETKRIDINKVHKDNIEMFFRAVVALDINYTGLDLIIPDIEKSYKEQKCCINELNSAPDIGVHYYADFALSNIAAEKLMRKYFDM